MPFEMAHTPLKMTIKEAHAEVKYGWSRSYSPEAIEKAVGALKAKPLGYRVNIFLARLCFRGIYFPQMGPAGMGESDCSKSADYFQASRRSVSRLVPLAVARRRKL